MSFDFQSRNLVIPRGVFTIAPFKPGTMTPGAQRQIGNTPEFSLGGEVNRLDHYSSQFGMQNKDESIIIARQLSATFTTDDTKAENIGYFFMGRPETITSTAQTGAETTITDVEVGGTYQLGVTAENPVGARNVSDVVVTSTGGTPTTYTEGTDYTIDAEYGLVTVVTGGGIVAESDIEVTFNTAASTFTRVAAGDIEIEGEVRFYSYNPFGQQEVILIPRAKIGPNGELPLMTDPESPAWKTIPLSLEILKKGNMALLYRDGVPVVQAG